jgi:DNA-binding MarR family transcriptional regulator
MKLQTVDDVDRTAQIDYVASELLPRAAVLIRLLVSQLCGELSRTEVGLLGALTDGPRRITELAQLEQLAQPTMTLLVKRLEERGWLVRERQADDGRVVMVSLTDAGSEALAEFRGRASAALRVHLAEMSDERVEALGAATETLAQLVTCLQQGPDLMSSGEPHATTHQEGVSS